jgi:hypothetical protein
LVGQFWFSHPFINWKIRRKVKKAVVAVVFITLLGFLWACPLFADSNQMHANKSLGS